MEGVACTTPELLSPSLGYWIIWTDSALSLGAEQVKAFFMRSVVSREDPGWLPKMTAAITCPGGKRWAFITYRFCTFKMFFFQNFQGRLPWAFLGPFIHEHISFITIELGRLFENFKVVCIWVSLGTSLSMKSGLPKISSRIDSCSTRLARFSSWAPWSSRTAVCSSSHVLCSDVAGHG